jgi:hypothetical protein
MQIAGLSVGFVALNLVIAGTTTDTEFTYQGFFKCEGDPYTGLIDISATVFDAQMGGTQVGDTVTVNGVFVQNGTFFVNFDFGAEAFSESGRYLALAIRKPPAKFFTPLFPRQKVTAAPEALWSKFLRFPYDQPITSSTTVNDYFKITVDNTDLLPGSRVLVIETPDGKGIEAQTEFGTAISGIATDTGTGIQGESADGTAAELKNTSPTNPNPVLDGTQEGTGPGYKIYLPLIINDNLGVDSTTDGTGSAIKGENTNPSNDSPAIEGETSGTGPAIQGTNSGISGGAGAFLCNNMSHAHPCILCTNDGTGSGLKVENTNPDNTGSVIEAITIEGNVLRIVVVGPDGTREAIEIEGPNDAGLIDLDNTGTGPIGTMDANTDQDALTIRNTGIGTTLRIEGTSATEALRVQGKATLVGTPETDAVEIQGGASISGPIKIEGPVDTTTEGKTMSFQANVSFEDSVSIGDGGTGNSNLSVMTTDSDAGVSITASGSGPALSIENTAGFQGASIVASSIDAVVGIVNNASGKALDAQGGIEATGQSNFSTTGVDAIVASSSSPSGRAALIFNASGGEGLRTSSINGLGLVADVSGSEGIGMLGTTNQGRTVVNQTTAGGVNTQPTVTNNNFNFGSSGVYQGFSSSNTNPIVAIAGPNFGQNLLVNSTSTGTSPNPVVDVSYQADRTGVSITDMGPGSNPALEVTGDQSNDGDLDVTGDITGGTKMFRIDHPLDPENRILQHCSVESADMMTIYSGNVQTDENGWAQVVLPNWFGALNTDFRYQLTTIGSFARVMVAEEIRDNRFVIRSDGPAVRVSWQVTATRKDAYAMANPITVEVAKGEKHRGLFLHPTAHNRSESLGIHHASKLRARESLNESTTRMEQTHQIEIPSASSGLASSKRRLH